MMFTVSSCAFIQWISLIQLLKPLVLMLLGIWYYAVRLVEFTDALAASGYVTSFVISVCIVGAPLLRRAVVFGNGFGFVICWCFSKVWWLFAEFSFTMINLIDFKLIVIAHFRSIGFIGCEVRLHFVHFTLNIGVMCCCGLWFAASVLLALMVYLVSGILWLEKFIYIWVCLLNCCLPLEFHVWQVCSSFLVVLSWSCGDIKQIVFGMLCLDVLWVLLTVNWVYTLLIVPALCTLCVVTGLHVAVYSCKMVVVLHLGLMVCGRLFVTFVYLCFRVVIVVLRGFGSRVLDYFIREFFCFDAFSQVEFPMKWVWVRVKF
eukprot:gene13080-8926_t